MAWELTVAEPAVLPWETKHLHLAIQAAGVTLWSWNVDTDELTMDERAFALWGLPYQATVTFEDLSARIHPKDRDRVRAAFQATRAIVGAFEIDFRIMLWPAPVRWPASYLMHGGLGGYG